jgi:microcompartment protein CcmK/EutM
MYVGRVSGTVVATIKNELFERHKLLVVDRIPLDGLLDGVPAECLPSDHYDIAVDMVQAGVGDTVLVLDEGNSARQILDREPDGAIRAVIVGIVDDITVAKEMLEGGDPGLVVKDREPRTES